MPLSGDAGIGARHRATISRALIVAALLAFPSYAPAESPCSAACDKAAAACTDACEARLADAKARVECKLACIAEREACDKTCR